MDPLITFNFIAIPALMAVSFGLGFYIGERGISGIKIDLANTKLELEKVKNFVSPSKETTVITPVANPIPANTPTAATSAGI